MVKLQTRRDVEATHIRKVVLGHALLSYALGTGILAVAINLMTNSRTPVRRHRGRHSGGQS